MSLAVVAAMFAGISTASAAGPTAGACIFTGLSGNLAPAIQSTESDVLQGSPLDIEQGNYFFTTAGATTPAVCAGLFQGTPAIVAGANITSNGSYDNIVCGTGFAHDYDGNGTNAGGANALGGPAVGIGPNFPGSGTAGYEIPFVAGNGPLLIGAPVGLAKTLVGVGPFAKDAANSGVQQDPTATTPLASNYVGAGAVNIVPDGIAGGPGAPGGDCGTTNTSGFHVSGFFVGVSK